MPFDLFRYASKSSQDAKDRMDAARDYPDRYVNVLDGPASVLEHIRTVVGALPPGWQATVLPQGVIVYKELADYDYALAGWRRAPGGAEGLRRGPAVR